MDCLAMGKVEMNELQQIQISLLWKSENGVISSIKQHGKWVWF